ncbi:MAG TPA: hypothetical protein PLR65_03235 [Anaerolineales bacterium]|nr:hypothetical protein [Anaerolineales bacterium]
MPPENEENKRRIKKLLDSEAETRAETPIEPKVDEQGTTKASAAKKTPPPYFDPADTLLFGDENSEPRHIPLDENNMPLPRRVNEVDMDGTRVSPVAYERASRPRGMTETRRVSPQVSRAKPRPHPSIGDPSTGKKLADVWDAPPCWHCSGSSSSPSSSAPSESTHTIPSRGRSQAWTISRTARRNLKRLAFWTATEICCTRFSIPPRDAERM